MMMKAFVGDNIFVLLFDEWYRQEEIIYWFLLLLAALCNESGNVQFFFFYNVSRNKTVYEKYKEILVFKKIISK